MSPQAQIKTLYACVCATEFPAQALLRLRPDLQSEPVAVLEGRAPLEAICSLNRQAYQRGAALRMTRLEAEGITGLRLLARSMEVEAAARDVLLECVSHFSPRIEESSESAVCSFVLDIAGTELLFGPPEALAQRLRATLLAAGFRASIAVSANFHTARLKASATHGITVISEGQEATALHKLPLTALSLADEHASGVPGDRSSSLGWLETFAIWGIRTLGELAALPEVDLITRLGPQAKSWRNLARGAAQHTFQPIEPEFKLKELFEFETPVEQMDSLLFMGARMIDCLVGRATTRALSLASLTIEMSLEGGREHKRVIRPALPSVDRKFLLKLLQLEIAAHPPPAAVLSLTLTADAGQSSTVQLGLFAPQMPEPSRLDVTIARLKAIAGEDRVGSPVLEDSHRSGSFRMEDFSVSGLSTTSKANRPRMALRRMRPPVPVRVKLRATKPAAFRDPERNFEITAAYGPWRSAGCWWSPTGWDEDEWDVLAQTGNGSTVACLLVQDRSKNQWRLEAYYD
ncbi:MAG: DNA polymerase Y family protein [Terracidiphilus sp.]